MTDWTPMKSSSDRFEIHRSRSNHSGLSCWKMGLKAGPEPVFEIFWNLVIQCCRPDLYSLFRDRCVVVNDPPFPSSSFHLPFTSSLFPHTLLSILSSHLLLSLSSLTPLISPLHLLISISHHRTLHSISTRSSTGHHAIDCCIHTAWAGFPRL